MPPRRSAPVNVVVFQWPWGTAARQRWPRWARPRRRVILVEAPVSSINTRRCGSRSGWASNQSRRCAATSGRSCSAAWAVFFEGKSVTVEKPPDRTGREAGIVPGAQQIRQLVQTDVLLGLDGGQDRFAQRLDMVRSCVTALWFGTDRTGGGVGVDPANGARHRHMKLRRRAAARQTTRDGCYHPGSKICRKRFAHKCRPPAQHVW